MPHADIDPRSCSGARREGPLSFLLVAGASGGGKSTFIRSLIDGRLSRDILRELPEGCSTWPIIEANNMLKNSEPLSKVLKSVGSAKGAILHYDIAFIHRFALPGYESDPAAELFALANRLDTVLVKTDLDRLQRQHSERHDAQQQTKNGFEIFWGGWVRRPLRQVYFSLIGRPAVDTKALYLDPQFLSKCYGTWEGYIRRLATSKPAQKILTVEPAQQIDGSPVFRLVSAQVPRAV